MALYGAAGSGKTFSSLLISEGLARHTGKLVLTQVTMSPKWIGEPIKLAEMSAGARVAYIDRLGEAVVPQIGTVLQEGDVVHVIAKESELDRVMAGFAKRDGSEH